MKKHFTEPAPLDPERPEPFVTMMELVGQYGKLAVLEALSNLAGFDSDDPSFSDEEREADSILHIDLSTALEQYVLFFSDSEADPGPVAQINYRGVLV
jgi:hypothetical protein